MAIHFDDIRSDVAAIFLSYFQRAPEFEAMQHYASRLRQVILQQADANVTVDLNGSVIYLEVDEDAVGLTGRTLTVRGRPAFISRRPASR